MLRSMRAGNAAPSLRTRSARTPVSSPALARSLIQRSSVRTYATTAPSTATKPNRHYARSLFTTLFASVVLFYGVSVPLGLYSIRYRDFLVETVPGGEQLGDYIDAYELKKNTAGALGAGGAGASTTSLTQYAENKAKASGWELKPASVTEPREVSEESLSEVAKHRAEAAARKVKTDAAIVLAQAKAMEAAAVAKAESVAAAAEHKVEELVTEGKELVDEATTMIKEATDNVESALTSAAASMGVTFDAPEQSTPAPVKTAAAPVVEAASAPLPSTKSTSSDRPRQLDATPLPKKRANNETYTGPPLPIGFEPPVGFELPRPPPTPKGELQPIPLPPAPLPLVAPAVQDLATVEPVLGQLAATIDSLAKFVANNTEAVSHSASTVLKSAEADIQSLGERLETIKREENAKLEESLRAQAREYTELLGMAERDMLEKLEFVEDDWKKAFDSERSTLVEAYKAKLDNELATQQEIINARLKEEVVAQGIELQRRWVREIKVRVEQERGGRLAKLEELEGGIRKLEKVTKENEETISASVQARKVWTAVKAVEHKVATGAPFDEELRALKRLAEASSDSVITLALSTVPEMVATNGITSFPSLAARFTTSVSPQLRRVALLPEHAGIFSYLTSYALSFLLFTKQGWAQGDDVISVIARAEFFLTNRDLESATKEINSLQGWPKKLSRDWLVAARNHLETKQALDIAEAQATLASLSAL